MINFRQILPKYGISSLVVKLKDKAFQKFWTRNCVADMTNAAVFVNTKSRGYYYLIRRFIFNKFVKKRNLKVFYVQSIDEIVKYAKKYDPIIIASGDGFFAGVMASPMLNKKTIGFFPMGAGNAAFPFFYNSMFTTSLLGNFNFYVEEIDILEVELDNSKIEALFVSIGLDAEWVRLNPPRSRNGLRDFFVGTVKSIPEAESSFPLNCEVDGKQHFWKHTINLTLGKLPFYGLGVRSLPYGVHHSDGKVYGLLCKGIAKMQLNKLVRLGTIISNALGFSDPALVKLKGSSFKISSENNLPVQAAGEFIGYSKRISVKVKRKQKVLIA